MNRALGIISEAEDRKPISSKKCSGQGKGGRRNAVLDTEGTEEAREGGWINLEQICQQEEE